MGARHQPLRIAPRWQIIAAVDAGDAIEDPRGADVITPDDAIAVLVDRPAALAHGADELHSFTTSPVLTLSSAARTIFSEFIASCTCASMSRSCRMASRNSICSRLQSS